VNALGLLGTENARLGHMAYFVLKLTLMGPHSAGRAANASTYIWSVKRTMQKTATFAR